MNDNKLSEELLDKGFITATQFETVKEYRLRNLFSIRNEINFFLFVSVILFTTGVGIFIYNNIDTIGHMALLTIILIVTALCYYYSFRHAPGFSKQTVHSEKPLYDYLALAGTILTGIFVSYLQYQYSVFGEHNDFATLFVAAIYFFCAYYFDHKGILSLAITALCAFVGFSASPSGLLHSNFQDQALAYYAMATALAFMLWTIYSERTGLKKHFGDIYRNFAMHISCIAAITQLFYPYWLLPFLILAAVSYYFIDFAFKKSSAYFFSFSFLYAFTGLSIFIGKLLILTDAGEIIITLTGLSPFYLVGAIILFIKSLKRLKKMNHASL